MPNPFTPEKLPIAGINWESHVEMVGRSNAALAKFEAAMYGIANPEIFIAPLRTKEAVLSSKIEGTQASFEEVLLFDASELGDVGEKKDDYIEIVNYRRALLHAESELSQKPFHLNMLLKMHEILLDSARGRDKARGKFRTVQNWIGPENSPMEDALFVPPPPTEVISHIGELEKYYHSKEKDPLVQLAIIHAQFEIIHPFLDGNGRLGRIMVPLFLFEKGLLSKPVFYLSAYLESHRDEYTQGLRNLSSPDSWDRWISFFLRAIEAQADCNREIARNIIRLYDHLKEQVVKETRSAYAISALDFAFERPYFLQSKLAEDARMPTVATSGNLVRQFISQGILKVIRPGRGRRSTILYAPQLMEVCSGSSFDEVIKSSAAKS